MSAMIRKYVPFLRGNTEYVTDEREPQRKVETATHVEVGFQLHFHKLASLGFHSQSQLSLLYARPEGKLYSLDEVICNSDKTFSSQVVRLSIGPDTSRSQVTRIINAIKPVQVELAFCIDDQTRSMDLADLASGIDPSIETKYAIVVDPDCEAVPHLSVPFGTPSSIKLLLRNGGSMCPLDSVLKMVPSKARRSVKELQLWGDSMPAMVPFDTNDLNKTLQQFAKLKSLTICTLYKHNMLNWVPRSLRRLVIRDYENYKTGGAVELAKLKELIVYTKHGLLFTKLRCPNVAKVGIFSTSLTANLNLDVFERWTWNKLHQLHVWNVAFSDTSRLLTLSSPLALVIEGDINRVGTFQSFSVHHSFISISHLYAKWSGDEVDMCENLRQLCWSGISGDKNCYAQVPSSVFCERFRSYMIKVSEPWNDGHETFTPDRNTFKAVPHDCTIPEKNII